MALKIGSLFFLRLSSHIPLCKKESVVCLFILNNHQSVSSCFTNPKTTEVFLNTHIQKSFFFNTQPTQTSALQLQWWTRQPVQKSSVGFLHVWTSQPLSSAFPESSTKTGFKPGHSIPLIPCTPNTTSPAQAVPWTQEQCFLSTASQVYHSTDRKGQALFPAWLKLTLPLNTTQRYYYLT